MKKMNRREMLKAMAATSMAGVLAACAKVDEANGTDENITDQAVPEAVTIRYGRHDTAAGVLATIDEFQAANPNIKVEMELIGEFEQKVPAMAAAGTLPDVLRAWEAMTLELGRSGQIMDLQSYIDVTSDFHPEDFYENWWNYSRMDGKHLGIPDAAAPHITFYNATLFDEAGVEYPDPANFTWADFEAKARAITNVDSQIWGSETIPVGWHYYSLKQVWQGGGDFFSSDYKSCVIDSPETIAALQYWADLLLDGGVMPSPAQISGFGGTDVAAQLLTAGKIAMQRMGTWILQDLLNSDIKFNIVPEPMNVRQDTITHGAFNTITVNSKHKDEAWAWINANCSTQGIYNYAADAKFPGARRSTNELEKKPWVFDSIEYEVNWDVIPQALEYGHVLPGPANEGEALKVIGDALEKIYNGTAKAADVLPGIVPSVDEILNR